MLKSVFTKTAWMWKTSYAWVFRETVAPAIDENDGKGEGAVAEQLQGEAGFERSCTDGISIT